MNKIFEKIKNRKGTTLIEMIIAFSLFGILIAITVSNFKQALELQQISTLLLESHDSVGLLFEQISREVRTSKNLSGGGSSVSFRHQDGYEVSYSFSGGKIMRGTNGKGSYAVTSSNPKISIDSFSTYIVNPCDPKKCERLTMSVTTSVKDKKGNEYKSVIQTTVSPRFYNEEYK